MTRSRRRARTRLHAMLLRDKDIRICLEWDRPSQQDAPFRIDLFNLDPVCLRHLAQRGIDLLIDNEECLVYTLPRDSQHIRNGDIGMAAAPQLPEPELFLVRWKEHE